MILCLKLKSGIILLTILNYYYVTSNNQDDFINIVKYAT